ncbi:unnamed protein product [marine sediment metagenome]|uniref:Uncharacterized protein n=1 Tax=marine sediment metagenome TaxID=412755 RepID=X1HFD3_9ZZZZ
MAEGQLNDVRIGVSVGAALLCLRPILPKLFMRGIGASRR